MNEYSLFAWLSASYMFCKLYGIRGLVFCDVAAVLYGYMTIVECDCWICIVLCMSVGMMHIQYSYAKILVK